MFTTALGLGQGFGGGGAVGPKEESEAENLGIVLQVTRLRSRARTIRVALGITRPCPLLYFIPSSCPYVNWLEFCGGLGESVKLVLLPTQLLLVKSGS